MKFDKNWYPTNENGEITNADFDKRFSIDRKFKISNWYKVGFIRFVKYDNCEKLSVHWMLCIPSFLWRPLARFAERNMSKTNFFLKILFNISIFCCGICAFGNSMNENLTEAEILIKYGYDVTEKIIKQ